MDILQERISQSTGERIVDCPGQHVDRKILEEIIDIPKPRGASADRPLSCAACPEGEPSGDHRCSPRARAHR